MALVNGDAVRVIAGKYKGLTGTYDRAVGMVSAVVHLNSVGGFNLQKTLRRSSLEKIETQGGGDGVHMAVDIAEFNHVQAEIAELTKALRRLQVRVDQMRR